MYEGRGRGRGREGRRESARPVMQICCELCGRSKHNAFCGKAADMKCRHGLQMQATPTTDEQLDPFSDLFSEVGCGGSLYLVWPRRPDSHGTISSCEFSCTTERSFEIYDRALSRVATSGCADETSIGSGHR
eukprot:6211773-Pleurochrysis_carterae.AAC.2